MSSPTADASTDTWKITGSHPDRDARVHELAELMTVVVPVIEADGGTLTVNAVDVDTGEVTVTLAGACGSCAISATTLEAGIARVVTQRLDWVTAIHGNVDASDDTGSGGWVPRG